MESNTTVHKKSSFHDKVELSFNNFCDKTSLHGYNLLYYAKAKYWIIFWFCCTTFAAGITIYQIKGAVSQYMDQSSSTMVRVAEEGEIVYPPLKLCYSHWLQWVDFEKAYSMNFTNESLLVGMSKQSRVFTEHRFNFSVAVTEFVESMKLNNLTRMTEFFNSISKFAPLQSWGSEEEWLNNYSTEGGKYFKHKEFHKYQKNYLLFCYMMMGDEIKQTIADEKVLLTGSGKNNLVFSIKDEHAFKEDFPSLTHITMHEYNSYMAEWIQTTTPQYYINEDSYINTQVNYTTFDPPLVVFPDGYTNDGIKIQVDVDEVYFTVKASAHVWKNTITNPCEENKVSVVSDKRCEEICTQLWDTKNKTMAWFEDVFLYDRDDFDSLSFNDYYFLDGFGSVCNIETTTPTSTVDDVTTSPNSTEEIRKQKQNCTRQCAQGCTKWSFDVIVTYGSIYSSVKQFATKKNTNIQISYPLDGSILVTVETDSQSWENVIGSVGGLLGIWTGASILSLFEIVYLCCFKDSKDEEQQRLHNIKSKNWKRRGSINQNPVSMFNSEIPSVARF